MIKPHPMAGSSQDDNVGALIEASIFEGHKRLDRSIGEIARGGMASVEAAGDRTLGRRVALKLLHSHLQNSSLAVRSFIREAQITGQLAHPNIVPVHELAIDERGQLYFTMSMIEGQTLLALINEQRASHNRIDKRGLKISTTIEHEQLVGMIDVLLKVLDAVAFAHARGVAHCDIKSENVMVGAFGQVYLMDWGIAKLLDDPGEGRTTRVRDTLPPVDVGNVVMGTPSYMSPEQAYGMRQSIDHRSDIFALGAMLYEILTGHPPFQGASAQEELELAAKCEPVLLPHLAITRELRRIVGVAMNADPDQRYQSVEQFRADLQGFMRGGDNFPRRRFAKGKWLIREGQTGDAAYILVSGRCEVSKQVEGQRKALRTLGPGDVFGETAILAEGKRTASVMALTEVVAVIVTADALDREVDAMKPWMGSFIRALAQRFSDVEERVTTPQVDPAQIANLALMTLKTWGRRRSDHSRTMSLLKLCESIAKLTKLRENKVLKILRHYEQFEIDLTEDVIVLRDVQGLAQELMPHL